MVAPRDLKKPQGDRCPAAAGMPDCARRTRRRDGTATTCPETMDKEAPMTIQVGDKLPSATLKQLTAEGIKDVSTADLTRGKKVVLFAVPGAFTPTCSERHLPGFVEQADALKAKGVDAVACVAVNDPFVLSAWEKSRNVGGKVQMLSDGNGEFTRALGLEFDGSGFGLGKRSRRYAMVVEDGTVRTLLVEEVPSQAEASSASAILATL
jgi:peroxiredoxin